MGNGVICAIHGVAEADQPGDFMLCNECWHIWRSKEEYDFDVAMSVGWSPLSRRSCPLCADAAALTPLAENRAAV
jgi:hypothetical protein